MERRRPPLSTIIFLLIMFMMIFSPILESYPILLLIVLVVAVLAFIVIGRRRGGISWPPSPPDEFRTSRPPISFPEQPRIGRWIVIPIAITGVIAFILYQNWWLDVSVLQYMYGLKAGLDWWQLQFLDNHYFYACLGIGLLIALSDPRVSIDRGVNGERRFYLHSKFLGVLRILRSLLSRYSMGGLIDWGVEREAYDDRVSIKAGLAWKFLEFLVGTFIIGPLLAQGLALQYLIISRWLEVQQISWIGLIQRSISILWTRLTTGEMPTGTWLVVNSPVLEFITWLRTPVNVFCVIWGLRFAVSLFFGFLNGDVVRVFRSVTLIGLAALTPFVLQVPTKVFDITTPLYVRTMVIGELVLIVLAIFFSMKQNWVQRSVASLFRRKMILTVIVVLTSLSLLSGPIEVAFSYAPAMEGNWEDWIWDPKVKPRVEYTNWATGLGGIEEDDLSVAINTGENLEILGKIRVFNDNAANLRLKTRIGVNWMDLQNIDVIWLNEREYWVSALTIMLPPTGEDVWRSERMIITHSERILALDAGSGEIVSGQSVFNLSDPSLIYYGEDGLFKSSKRVYVDVPGFQENHLPEYTGPESYQGEPDFVLEGFNRFWHFSGIYGGESARWDFARGDHGDEVNMLYLRDIRERISNLLLPGMTVDEDPYLVSDGRDLYYALYVYINRDMPTEYLNYPSQTFLRDFAVILVNTYNGSIRGYFMSDEDNYINDFYRTMYPQWDKDVPNWLKSQLRYPEFLFELQIDAYNTYHVTDPDVWQGKTDFFELTTDLNENPIEDVRYIVFYMNRTTRWATVRLVQQFKSPALNIAAMYVALNGEGFGSTYLLRSGTNAIIGPQTALESISNYSPTKSLLSLHPNWEHGNILMYVVNGTILYFVPYYAETTTTLSPAMVTVVSSESKNVGYYVINNPQDASEAGAASDRAYTDLVGLRVEMGAEERKSKVLERFDGLGYTVKTPQQINPNVAFTEASINYQGEDDWPKTDAAITGFLQDWAEPIGLNTILMWETSEGELRALNFGVLISMDGVVELHSLRIIYTSD